MSGEILGNQGPVFGMDTSLDLFEKLKHESHRLQQGWHSYDTFNFLVTAWHLFQDWPKSDDPTALCKQKRQRTKLPNPMNFVLDVVRDLVNGSKHFQLTNESANKRRVNKVHTGVESGWYSWFFHENLPAVTAEDNWYFTIRSLNNIIIRYFEWVFDDSSPVKHFPNDILEAIEYCNIAKRSGPRPKLLSS